ncbi:hypothetical protein ACFQMM_22525 [Saliphagus sp. GCM10025308]
MMIHWMGDIELAIKVVIGSEITGDYSPQDTNKVEALRSEIRYFSNFYDWQWGVNYDSETDEGDDHGTDDSGAMTTPQAAQRPNVESPGMGSTTALTTRKSRRDAEHLRRG